MRTSRASKGDKRSLTIKLSIPSLKDSEIANRDLQRERRQLLSLSSLNLEFWSSHPIKAQAKTSGSDRYSQIVLFKTKILPPRRHSVRTITTRSMANGRQSMQS
jgi:hypothetical protein